MKTIYCNRITDDLFVCLPTDKIKWPTSKRLWTWNRKTIGWRRHVRSMTTCSSAVFTDPVVLMRTARLRLCSRQHDLKIESSKIDGMKVQMFGNTGSCNFTLQRTKETYMGKDISGQSTDVFVKWVVNGNWSPGKAITDYAAAANLKVKDKTEKPWASKLTW